MPVPRRSPSHKRNPSVAEVGSYPEEDSFKRDLSCFPGTDWEEGIPDRNIQQNIFKGCLPGMIIIHYRMCRKEAVYVLLPYSFKIQKHASWPAPSQNNLGFEQGMFSSNRLLSNCSWEIIH